MVAFSPTQGNSGPLTINGLTTNFIPVEAFGQFIDKMRAAVELGEFDAEIERAAKHGGMVSGTADVAIPTAKIKRATSEPKAAPVRRADWDSLSFAQKQRVSALYRYGKNPDGSVIAEVGERPRRADHDEVGFVRTSSAVYSKGASVSFVATERPVSGGKRTLLHMSLSADYRLEMDVLDWFAHWYEAQCDSDWEHGFGPRIGTIDNPGWSLKVELAGTDCDGRVLDRITSNYEHETDWWTCWTEGNAFHGAGGPLHLRSLLESFRDWATNVG